MQEDEVASWRIIIPLLNKQVVTFRGPVWYLGDGVYCRTIADEDFGALWRHFGEKDNEYKPFVTPSSKCIYTDGTLLAKEPKPSDLAQFAKGQSLIIQSVLNLFSTGNPAVLSFAAVVQESRKTTVTRIVDLEPAADIHRFRDQRYKIKPSATQQLVHEMYTLVSQVIHQRPQVRVTLTRYNSSLTRIAHSDRIIDTTISLESLIREKHELRFKFSTYLSFVLEADPKNRLKAFRLLATLYDARSGLVHGTPNDKSVKKALTEVLDNWEYISHMTKTAIIYYLLYLSSESERPANWSEHLKRLMLGIDTRIVS
jgi:hypothetical protein